MEYTIGSKFDVKVIDYGNGEIETIQYSSPYFTGTKAKTLNSYNNDNAKEYSEEYKEARKQINKRQSLYRSLKKVHSLVRCNHGQYDEVSKFITLTFEDNVTDFDFANDEFNKFISRLNYFVYGYQCRKLVYLGIREPQKRGAIHYHVIFFNLPFIKKSDLDLLWSEGSNNVSAIKDNSDDLKGVEDVASYVTKYMSKSFYSDDSFYYDFDVWGNKKAYFTSRSVKRPKEHRLLSSEFDRDIIDALIPYSSEVLEIESKQVAPGVFSRSMLKTTFRDVPEVLQRYVSTTLNYCTARFVKKKFEFKLHRSLVERHIGLSPCSLSW